MLGWGGGGGGAGGAVGGAVGQRPRLRAAVIRCRGGDGGGVGGEAGPTARAEERRGRLKRAERCSTAAP